MNGKAKEHRGGQLREKVMQVVFLIAACISILAVALICIYLFANGLPAIAKIGPFEFLLGTDWRPNADHYGIFPMIIGSIYVTAGAIIVGVPLGLLAAIYMAKFCPAPLYKILKPAVDLLAGIPSIVYGFFGLMVIVPLVQDLFGAPSGQNMLTASILLGIMILPTIISVSESSIRAVPDSYYEGALALGASHERSVFFVTVPAAKSGIMAGIILGVGRAIGETMAVIMIAGNQPRPTACWRAFAPSPATSLWKWVTPRACTGRPSSPPAWCCSCLFSSLTCCFPSSRERRAKRERYG